jgi:hypothetical protein
MVLMVALRTWDARTQTRPDAQPRPGQTTEFRLDRRMSYPAADGRMERPCAQKVTAGASEQRSHRPCHEPHEEKVAAIQQGKQGWQEDTEAGISQQVADYEQDKRFADHEDYTDEHARVFGALTDAQQARDGEAVYLDEVARAGACPARALRVAGVVAVGGGDVPLLQTGVGFRAHPQQALLEAGSPALAACGPPQH